MEKSFKGYWNYKTNTGMTIGTESKVDNCVLLYLDFNKNVKMSSNQIYYSFFKVKCVEAFH